MITEIIHPQKIARKRSDSFSTSEVIADQPSPTNRLNNLGLLRAGDSILFIGDSITDAFRKPEEINIAFQLGSGYTLMIGARLMREYPESKLHFINRGASGNRVTDLANRWEKDCIGLAPDVVSILIGVNSTTTKFRTESNQTAPDADYDNFCSIYDTLLRDLVSARPNVRVVIGEPFLLPCGVGKDALIADLRVRSAYLKRLATKHKALFVPFQSAFDEALAHAPAEYWAYDGMHPTAAGFWLMAETWIKCVVKQTPST